MIDSTSLATFTLLACASALLLVAMLYPAAMLRWFQRKRYQYEVTFSLYMLTSTEKFIFSKSSPPFWSPPRSTQRLRDEHARDYANTHARRLSPLPPSLTSHNRRVAIPSRSPYHNCEPPVLLLLRQRGDAREQRAESWTAVHGVESCLGSPAWSGRRIGGPRARHHGAIRSWCWTASTGYNVVHASRIGVVAERYCLRYTETCRRRELINITGGRVAVSSQQVW
jgi:hypothetical protein